MRRPRPGWMPESFDQRDDLPLFDLSPSVEPSQPSRRRFVASTSRKAYDQLKLSLKGRELFVLAELRAYEKKHGTQPTAYELIEFAKKNWPDLRIDPNSVRPRLCALLNAKRDRSDGRTYVQKVEKRTCTVTGKTAWTWRCL